MASEIFVIIIGLENGMLSDDIKPLHEPVLPYYPLDPQENEFRSNTKFVMQ